MSDRPAAGRLGRRVALAAAVAAVAVGIVYARVAVSSRARLAEGRAAVAAGRPVEGVELLRRAARLWAPGLPWSDRALGELEAIGRVAQARGNDDLALAAWQAVRSGVLGARWALASRRGRLPAAHDAIAGLLARQAGADAAWRARERARLDTTPAAPSSGWTVVALAGLAAWLSGAASLACAGAGWRARMAAVTALLAGALAFAIGLWRA